MFSPERIREGYGDYRESIGRPRVNKIEDLKESIPYNHFIAGIEFCLREMGSPAGKLYEDEVENAEDAL